MSTERYPNDLTDEQRALIEFRISFYPRRTSMRDALDVPRTGCQGRYRPNDFLPESTVRGYFDEWRHNGTLAAIRAVGRGDDP
jgi:putative transposase